MHGIQELSRPQSGIASQNRPLHNAALTKLPYMVRGNRDPCYSGLAVAALLDVTSPAAACKEELKRQHARWRAALPSPSQSSKPHGSVWLTHLLRTAPVCGHGEQQKVYDRYYHLQLKLVFQTCCQTWPERCEAGLWCYYTIYHIYHRYTIHTRI